MPKERTGEWVNFLTKESKELFTREASGLVRGMTGTDALIGNVLLANLIFGSFGLLLVPVIFQGASLVWSLIFATIAAFFMNIVYVLFGSTFPVSGGDYVYNSRTLHPAIGFAANVSMILAAGAFIAIYGNWAMTIGLAAMLETLGTVSNNPDLINLAGDFSGQNVTFVIATVMTILALVIVLTGLKRSLFIMKIMFIIGMIGVGLAIFIVLFTSNNAFVSNFNEYANYDQVINDAANQGFPVIGWNKIGPALLGIGFAGLTVIYTQNSVYAGGELQNPQKNMTKSIMGALAILAPLSILMALGMQRNIGSQFIGAMQWLFNNYAPLAEYPLEAQPSYNLFAGIAAPSTAFIFLMGLGFVLWPFGTMIFVFTFTSRAVMAWSFDRILPDKLSEVNETYNTPTYAILFIFVITELALILYTYLPSFAAFIGAITVMTTITYFTTSVAGIVFPFRRKKLYEGSPAERSVAGIPLMTIAGIIATIFMAIAMIGLFDPDVYFAYGIRTYLFYGLLFPVSAIIVYFISRFLRKRQGIDLDMIYDEIPPA